MAKKINYEISGTHIIMFSFLVAIIIGSILLSLPISTVTGISVSYIDALFTATSATCVTGLVTVSTVATWSLFGQIVILILIQIGGLGIITIMYGFMIALHRRMGLSNRLLIQDAFNLNTLSGLVRFVKKVIIGTFVVESIGALLYMTVFVPEFGIKGVWISLFNSVSAFCNAGIDIVSDNSLCHYATNPIINIVTGALIVIGGIGYIVWWDVHLVLKNAKRTGVRCFKNLTLHSKIALFSTAFLILTGAVAFFVFEYNNPLTIKEYSLFDKVQVSFFQSITTRTAGFATIPQQNLSNASSFVSLILMFIGGSPVGTAGGVKTVTIMVLFASAVATIKNNNEIVLFNRNNSKQVVSKALAVVSISFITMFVSTIMLCVVTDASALDVIYETVSATATVGLTRNLTSELNIWGKIIIIVTMYLGRVGPISLAIAFKLKRQKNNIVKNPTEDISVG